jgi:uncharacterized protein (TIGR00255 family)
MVKSMTGFGRGEYAASGFEFVVEIKTINHRYLDMNIRMPRQYSFLEENIRKVIPQFISRGKIDINVNISDFENSNKKVLFNEEIIKSYLEEAKKLESDLGLKNNFAFSNVLMLSDAVKIQGSDDEEQIAKDFSMALSNALNSLVKMRETEGNALKENILLKAHKLLDIFASIEERSASVVNEYKEKLSIRVNELLAKSNVVLEETRLATEVALFADRACIDEEITRFKSHITQLKNTLDLNEPIGKRLDFIIQELNRETNTIGSKSNDLTITNAVIEIKNILEQIREQIQNIE